MVWNPGEDKFLRRIEATKQEGKIRPPSEQFEARIDEEALAVASGLEEKVTTLTDSVMKNKRFASLSTLSRDLQYVENAEKDFEKRPDFEKKLHTMGRAFEYLAMTCINKGGWFGHEWKAQLTSPYDDLKNGIDMYFEKKPNDQREAELLGVSVDVTFSKKEKDLIHKIERIKDFQLDRGRLAQLKYYIPVHESAAEDTPREFTPLPKVIIGVNGDWVQNELKKFGVEENITKVNPGFGLIFLQQMEMQLLAYQEYSEKVFREQKRSSCETAADAYGKAAASVRHILHERVKLIKLPPGWVRQQMAKDPVSVNLKKQLAAILGTEVLEPVV